jgi:UDP-N-acetylglucosamine 1-carboxyvinyltransferase
MSRFVIEGGYPLRGVIRPVGNKNGALPMLAACLLTDEPVILRNVPDIEDVQVMLNLLADLGVETRYEGGTAELCAAGLRSTTPSPELCRRARASILLAGPLIARHRQVALSPPGGDVIGLRRLDTHFNGFRELGIDVHTGPAFVLKRETLTGADFLLDEASVTATENLVMAAVLAEGDSIFFNTACEPHVRDLCNLLIKMGARMQGHGTNRIAIQGVGKLHGAEHTVGADYIEVGSYLAAAAVTGGELTVEEMNDVQPLRILSRGFNRVGLSWTQKDHALNFTGGEPMQVEGDLGFGIPKIDSGVWPAFPSDMMSVAVVMATQANGSILFFEKMFESRMYFVSRLIDMGAHIIQCDPHRVLVQGPTQLRGIHITSPDIRAGMALLIAALCAKGHSIIDQAQIIERGYEDVVGKLTSLGARVGKE